MKNLILFLSCLATFYGHAQTTTILAALANPCSQQPLEINNFEKKLELSLFPNPSTGIVNLDLFADDNMINPQLMVFDMKGIVVYDLQIDNQSNRVNVQLPLQNLSSGIYLILLTTDKNRFTKKLIINK